MARKKSDTLTQEAVNFLRGCPEIWGDIAKALDIEAIWLPNYIHRNAPSLCKKPCRIIIAAKMGVDADTLIEEKDAELV